MYLQSFAEKLDFYAFFLIDTPDYLINIRVSLLSCFHFSSHYILISCPTFIDFTGNIHPISLKTEIFMNLMNFIIVVVNFYCRMFAKSRPFWKPLFQPLWQVMPLKFPSNTSIPYLGLMSFMINIHPILWFHKLRLLGRQE